MSTNLPRKFGSPSATAIDKPYLILGFAILIRVRRSIRQSSRIH
jgi:hypothetical protein